MTGTSYFSRPDLPETMFIRYALQFGNRHIVHSLINQLELQNTVDFSSDDALCLDLGSGSGISILPLASRLGIKNFFAIDGAQPMLDYVETEFAPLLPGVTVNTILADLESETINLPDGISLLTNSTATLSYISNISHVLSEACRLTMPSGFFSCNVSLHLNDTCESIYCLNPNNADTYAHSKKLMYELLSDHGFSLVTAGVYANHPSEKMSGTFEHTLIFRKK